MPTDLRGASALLRAWDAPDGEEKATRVLHAFNQMSVRGYDLNAAPETAAFIALRSTGALLEHYSIDTFRHTVQSRPARHEFDDIYTVSSVTQAGRVGGAEYYSCGDAQGSVFKTLLRYNTNLMAGYFGVNDVPQAREPEVVTCRNAFRATVRFDNGMVTQHIAEDVHLAGLLALKAGFEVELRRRDMAAAQPQMRRLTA